MDWGGGGEMGISEGMYTLEHKECEVKHFTSVSTFGFEWFWGQPRGQISRATAALTIAQKVLPIWKLVELKMLDFIDCTRTGISILTSAANIFSQYLFKDKLIQNMLTIHAS